MAVLLHGLQQDRHHGTQPLAADPIRGFPEHDQSLAYGIVVQPTVWPGAGSLAGLSMAQQTHGMLAVQARDRHEFVQDPAAFPTPAAPVSLCERTYQVIARCHGNPPHRCLPDPDGVESISDEATPQRPGTFQARQCEPIVGHDLANVVARTLEPKLPDRAVA